MPIFMLQISLQPYKVVSEERWLEDGQAQKAWSSVPF